MIRRGDIVLLSFPFTNLQAKKVRPAMVVSVDSYNSISNEAIFVFITSKRYANTFDMTIEESDPSFKATGLKVQSTFRVSKLMSLEQKLAIRWIGRADEIIIKKTDDLLKHLLGL